MPIPDPIKSDIANSARSHLARGVRSFASIVNAIMQKFSLTRLTDKAVVSNIVRQQQAAAVAAEQAISNPAGTPNVRDLPIDWSLKNAPGKYGYTIRATYTNPDTGRTTDTLLVVSSDRLLTSREALDEAQRIAESKVFVTQSTNPKALDQPQTEVTTELIAIGRRP